MAEQGRRGANLVPVPGLETLEGKEIHTLEHLGVHTMTKTFLTAFSGPLGTFLVTAQ